MALLIYSNLLSRWKISKRKGRGVHKAGQEIVFDDNTPLITQRHQLDALSQVKGLKVSERAEQLNVYGYWVW